VPGQQAREKSSGFLIPRLTRPSQNRCPMSCPPVAGRRFPLNFPGQVPWARCALSSVQCPNHGSGLDRTAQQERWSQAGRWEFGGPAGTRVAEVYSGPGMQAGVGIGILKRNLNQCQSLAQNSHRTNPLYVLLTSKPDGTPRESKPCIRGCRPASRLPCRSFLCLLANPLLLNRVLISKQHPAPCGGCLPLPESHHRWN